MHIVCLICDAISTAYLGPYGAEWVETPHLNRLACDGVVFDHCYSPCGVASLSDRIQAVVAGASLIPIRETDDPGEDSLRVALSNAHERIADPSMECCGVCVELNLRDAGWRPSSALLEKYLEDREPVDPAGRLVGWLDKDVTEDQIDALRDTYSARMEELDARLGEFLCRLRDRGLYEESLILFTAREGWPLGEHGMIGPAAPWAHEERDHVPLIVKYPGCRPASRCGALVTTLDVPPTVRAALERNAAPPRDANVREVNQPRNLMDLRSGNVDGCREAVFTGFETIEVAIRTHDWKLIVPLGDAAQPRTRMLFRKPMDRWEFNDLTPVHPDVADDLEQRIRSALG